MKSILLTTAIFFTLSINAQPTLFKKTLTDVGISKSGNNAMVLQSDNKIVTGGFTTNGTLNKITFLRYTAKGKLDSSFGINGVDTFSNILPRGYKYGIINSMAMQSNGRIIAGGTAYYSAGVVLYGDVFLIGLKPNGKLDSAFGNNGIMTTDFGFTEAITSICVQADDRILVAGSQFTGSFYRFFMARFKRNGEVDNRFRNGGISYGGKEDMATDITVQSDGKIVASGTAYITSSGYNFLVTRFLDNGQADASFGTAGKILTSISGYEDKAESVVIDSNSNIIVAGTTRKSFDATSNILAVRYASSGKIDSSYADNGIYTGDVFNGDEKINASYAQPDNKVVLAGYTVENSIQKLLVVRLNKNGNADKTFSEDGIATTSSNNQGDVANDVVVSENGEVITCGYSMNDASNLFSISGFKSNGIIDTKFGNDGIEITSVSISNDKAKRILRLPWNNTLLVAGLTGENWALMNYNTSLQLNASFGKQGKKTFVYSDAQGGSSPEIAVDSALQKIYIAGITDQEGFIVMRLNKDGSVDSSFGNSGFFKFNMYIYSGALAVTDDHKILFGGSVYRTPRSYPFVARYLTNGRPDASFAANGIFYDIPILPYGLTLSNNRIFATGIVADKNFNFSIAVAAIRGNKARIDSAFGTNGLAQKAIPNGSAAQYFQYRITTDASGKIYVNGGVQSYNNFNYQMSVTRFLRNGNVDETFGNKGIVVSNYSQVFDEDNFVNDALALNPQSNSTYSIITAGYHGTESYSTKFTALAFDYSGALQALPRTSSGYIDTAFYNRNTEACYAALTYDGYVYFAGVGGAKNETDFMLVKVALPQDEIEQQKQPVISLTANPNPAHGFVNAVYELTEDAIVQFRLVQLNGNSVYNLNKQQLQKGKQQTRLNISNVPKGLYALQLITGKSTSSVKVWVK